VAPHLIITEKSSNNALNELFIDFDSDLYNIDDNSNMSDSLSVQEFAAIQ
jgi:hypothetical protein